MLNNVHLRYQPIKVYQLAMFTKLKKIEEKEMKLMGFEESKIVKALDNESGNIDRAIDRIMEMD